MKPIVELDAETGLPMKTLEGKVEFYRGPEDAGKYRSIIRSSLRLISSSQIPLESAPAIVALG